MQQSPAFSVYNASAGSGKTFALVCNYLSILLKSKSPYKFRHVLAITFTNKAIGEMKSRIVKNLKLFTNGVAVEDSAMLQEVQKKTGLPVDLIRERSETVLQNIVQDYASFDVVTIDKFTHRIIRSFARDLKIPQNFELELNTGQVLELAVDNLIAKAGSDPELTPILLDYAIEKIDEDKSWDISRDFYDIAQYLYSENDRYYINLLKNRSLQDFKALKKNLLKQNKQLTEEIKEGAGELLSFIEANNLEPKHFNRKLLPNAVAKFQQGTLVYNPDSKWVQNLGNEPLYTKNQKPDIKAILDQITSEIAKRFKQLTAKIDDLSLNQELLRKITPLSLLKAIDLEVQKIKKEKNLLLISDFNEVINKNIVNQPTPFIYERLGERYQHYFIDEFQDTSILQWGNLIPLIDNALSSQEEEDLENSLMIVGDPKQAIYRWRGGYAEQFIALSAGQNPFQNQNYNRVDLGKNHRSNEQIIDFNNGFFNDAAQSLEHPVYKKIYIEGNKQMRNKRQGGYVSLSFVEAETVEESKPLYLERTLEILRETIEKGWKKNEISLIVRKNGEGILLAEYLQDRNIPVISNQSLLLVQSGKVRFIIDLLRFIQQPDAQEISIKLLEYLAKDYYNLEDPHAFYVKMLPLQGQQFFDALPDEDNFNVDHCQQLPLYDAVEYIVQRFKLNKDAGAYLQSFLDSVHDFNQKETSGVLGFLDWWETKGEDLSISVPSQTDAVQIITIHKAKGLEFPVVIYPFAESDLYPGKEITNWYPTDPERYQGFEALLIPQKKNLLNLNDSTAELYQAKRQQQQLDSLNTLYVALTRPVEQLHIISRKKKNAKPNADPGNYADLFINYLNNLNLWEKDTNEYSFGKNERQSHPEEDRAPGVLLELPSSPREANNLVIVTRAETLFDEHRQESINRGNLLHDILANITRAEDIVPVLNQSKQEGHLSDDVLGTIKTQLHEVIADLEKEGFFNPAHNVYAERELVHHGELLRPDRVEINAERQAFLLDYKTGTPHQGHNDQINNYALALVEAGYKVVKKILVYTNEEQSIQIV